MENKNYQIRFNNTSTDDSNRWRLISDGEELLVSNIVIDTQTYTTKNHIDGVGDKWHISCSGNLDIKDGIAYITLKRKDNAIKRHIYKTLTYRFSATALTVIVALCLGISIQIASLIGFVEILLKPILYFLHERIWFLFGKTSRDK